MHANIIVLIWCLCILYIQAQKLTNSRECISDTYELVKELNILRDMVRENAFQVQKIDSLEQKMSTLESAYRNQSDVIERMNIRLEELENETKDAGKDVTRSTDTVNIVSTATDLPTVTEHLYTSRGVPVCNTTQDLCSRYADCNESNSVVGYTCDCKFGFFGDGKTCTGSRGYEFIFLFMQNIRSYSDSATSQLSTHIYLAADNDGELTINTSSKLDSNIKSEMDREIRINSSGINSIIVSKLIRLSKDQTVESKGILVKSSEIITLFALNHEDYTSDSMLVLPVDRLGKTYFIPSSQPFDSYEDYQSQIGVVATEDGTVVTFHLKIRDQTSTVQYNGKDYSDGESFGVSLDKLDTFQVSHESDLTGTVVTANKHFGVVSGNRCNQLRRSPFAYCSHLVEMVPPVESWDTTYIIPPHYGHEGALVRILFSRSTIVNVEIGSEKRNYFLTQSGYVDESQNATTPVVVNANNTVQVLNFAKGGGVDMNPYFTMSQGLNQFVHEYNFAVPYNFENNYITVTIESAQASQLLLDGRALTSPTHTASVTIDSKHYDILTYAISEGSHKIFSQSESRFGLMIFGDRQNDGYGYPANILVQGNI